jgi:predicted enzyme involved in methoxymalonyl-ACP biosynthesis
MEVDGADARLPVWLMSCRVLSRGVEQHVMNHVVSLAKANGAKHVIGEYIPSAKNMMVKEFYGRFGYAKGEPAENGTVQWTLDVASYDAKKTLITETKS